MVQGLASRDPVCRTAASQKRTFENCQNRTFENCPNTLGRLFHRVYVTNVIAASAGVYVSEPLGTALRGQMAVPPPRKRG